MYAYYVYYSVPEEWGAKVRKKERVNGREPVTFTTGSQAMLLYTEEREVPRMPKTETERDSGR